MNIEANLEVARSRYGLGSGGVAVCEVHRPCLQRLEERIAHPPRLIPVPAPSGPLADEIQRGPKVRLSPGSKRGGEHEATIQDLHAKIGELTVGAHA